MRISVLLPEAALNRLKDKELLGQLRQTASLLGAVPPSCSRLAHTPGQDIHLVWTDVRRARVACGTSCGKEVNAG